jgi:hypothetical protein
MGWGPRNPEFVALTPLDIVEELWRLHFHDLYQKDTGTEHVSEFHGDDESFEEWVRELEEGSAHKDAEARDDDEFTDLGDELD